MQSSLCLCVFVVLRPFSERDHFDPFRRMFDIPWIPCWARIKIRKNSSDCLAKDDGTCLLQLRYSACIAVRNKVFEDDRTHRRPQALRIENVFNSYGHAMQCPSKTSGSRLGLTLARLTRHSHDQSSPMPEFAIRHDPKHGKLLRYIQLEI